jgi:hypothetical protein
MEKFLSMNLKQVNQKLKKFSMNIDYSQIKFFNDYSQFLEVFRE